MGDVWLETAGGNWVRRDAFNVAAGAQNGGDPWFVTLAQLGVSGSTAILKGEFGTQAEAQAAAGRIVAGFDPSAVDGGS